MDDNPDEGIYTARPNAYVFGAVFAVNSSLHSYLILAFSKKERVTMDVSFYYMAKLGERLIGTILSGLTFQVGGLALCLGMAAVMIVLNTLAANRLQPALVPEPAA